MFNTDETIFCFECVPFLLTFLYTYIHKVPEEVYYAITNPFDTIILLCSVLITHNIITLNLKIRTL